MPNIYPDAIERAKDPESPSYDPSGASIPKTDPVTIDRSGARFDRTTIVEDGKSRTIYTPKGELPESEPDKHLSQAQADYLSEYVAEQQQQPKSQPVFSEEQHYADTHSFEVKKQVTPVYRDGKVIGYQDPYSKQSVVLPKGKTVSKQELQDVSRRYQARETIRAAVEKKEIPKETILHDKPKEDPFVQRVEASQKRQKDFYDSPGFQRVRDVANIITFGGGKPYEARGWLGKYSQTVATSLMSWPIVLGGTLPMVGEKLAATAEGLSRKDARKNVGSEYFGVLKSPDFWKTFDITKPEGAATWSMVLIAALPKAYSTYAAKQQPVVTGRKIEVAQRTAGKKSSVTTVKNELSLKVGSKSYRVSGKGSQKSTIRDQVSYDYGAYKYKAVPYKVKGGKVTYQWKKAAYIDQDTAGYTVGGQGAYRSAGIYQNYNVLTGKYDTGFYGSRGEVVLVKDGLPTYKTLSYTEGIKKITPGKTKTTKIATGTYKIKAGKYEFSAEGKSSLSHPDYAGEYWPNDGKIVYKFGLPTKQTKYVLRHEVGHKLDFEYNFFADKQPKVNYKNLAKKYPSYKPKDRPAEARADYYATTQGKTTKVTPEVIKIKKTTPPQVTTQPKEVRGGFSTQTYEIIGDKATTQGWISTETVAGASYFDTLPKYGFSRDPKLPDPILREGYGGPSTVTKPITTSKIPPQTQQITDLAAKTVAKAAYMQDVVTKTQGKTAALSLMTVGLTKSEPVVEQTAQINVPTLDTREEAKQEIRPQLIDIVGEELTQEFKPISIVDTAQEQRQVSITGSRSEAVQEIGQLQRPMQETEQLQRPIQITPQLQETTPLQGPSITPQMLQQYGGAFAMFKPQQDQAPKRSSFDVFVRRSKIFKQIGTGETAEEAFTIGKQRVRSTAAASFKVTQAGQTVRQPTSQIFYESMKEPGVYIQKSQFRISSPGEKKDITYKGLLSLRIKKRGGFGL